MVLPLKERLRGVRQGESCRYVFGHRGEYEIQVASTIEQRRRAWALVYRNYFKKSYAKANSDSLWYGLHDALPKTTTFLATLDGKDVATLTLAFDSPLGLPAFEMYGSELDRLRGNGRRLCEIISLASEETDRHRRAEVLKHIFKLAYLTARRVEESTDFVVTVNPRHVAYYERILLFERLGVKRSYSKVGGAPAVLLRLDLEPAEERYRERYGRSEGSFFRFFVNPETEAPLVRFLQRNRRPLDEGALRTWFGQKRKILSQASPAEQEYLRSCYPSYGIRSRLADCVNRQLKAVEA